MNVLPFKINFEFEDPAFQPVYMTQQSSGADLFAKIDCQIKSQSIFLVPTGIKIKSVDLSSPQSHELPSFFPEIQIRARSSLAIKKNLILANGVGTIDLDYREEIKIPLFNLGTRDVVIARGERVAQLLVSLSIQLPQFKFKEESRVSGFGSTGGYSQENSNLL